MNKLEIIKAYLQLILSSLIWGGGFIFVKISMDYFSPIEHIFLRFTISALFVFLIYRNKIITLIKNERKYVLRSIFLGLFLFLAFWLQTEGIKGTTPGKNAFFTSTNVVVVPFLSWLFLRKKPKFYNFLSAFLCISGILLLIDFKNEDSLLKINKGDLLSLLCSIFFALHIVYTEFLVNNFGNSIMISFMQFLTVGFLSYIFLHIEDNNLLLVFSKIANNTFLGNTLNIRLIVSVLYTSLLSTLIAYMLQIRSQKYLQSNIVSLILSTEAVFGFIFSYLFFNEIISIKTFLGVFLIFLANFIVSFFNYK